MRPPSLPAARPSNEAAFIYQLFVRAHGPNNPPELTIVVGQSPGTNHPRMLTTLDEAKS